MGISSYIIFEEVDSSARSLALALYASQLGLNLTLSPLIFGEHRLDLVNE
jgi:tryptophan-rich sensory protein